MSIDRHRTAACSQAPPLRCDLIDDYDHLCQPTSADDLKRLRGRLATHVDVVAEAALTTADLPVRLAQQLAAGLDELADRAESLDPGQRGLVRAAIVYFLMTDDEANDLVGPHGLDDDLDVFHDVCDRVGQTDLKITP